MICAGVTADFAGCDLRGPFDRTLRTFAALERRNAYAYTRGSFDLRFDPARGPLLFDFGIGIKGNPIDRIRSIDHGVVEALRIAEGAGVAIVEFVHGDGWGKPRVVDEAGRAEVEPVLGGFVKRVGFRGFLATE